MKNLSMLAVVLFIPVFVFGCTSSGETKVGGAKPSLRVPGPNGSVMVTARRATGVFDDKDVIEAQAFAEAKRETANDPLVPGGTKPALANESSVIPKTPVQTMPTEKNETDKVMPGMKKETSGAEKPATMNAPAMPLARAIMLAEHNAVRNLAMLGAKRCMVCDDVSDLTQCLECGHHHKKGVPHSGPVMANQPKCPLCYGEEGADAVAYSEGVPCGACGEVHKTGPHCPHCPKAATENVKPEEKK